MKNLFLITLFYFISLSVKGSDTLSLYLIFDPINTPTISKDVRKHHMWYHPTPVYHKCYVSKMPIGDVYTTPHYIFAYPIDDGGDLKLRQKKGTEIKYIPLSELATAYPQAKTIQQLENELMPLIEADYNNPNKNPYIFEQQTAGYFKARRHKMYVIEIDHANNRAMIVEVEKWGGRM